MTVGITVESDASDALVDSRFGRAPYFAFANTETGEIVVEPNALAIGGGGVGSQVSQLMADRGVQAVITGHVGPNAFRVLQAAGIVTYTGAEGAVAHALSQMKGGDLEIVTVPGAAHSGGPR